MGIFLSSGIHGFLCSAKKELGKFKSSFVSGISGWMIKSNGDAEFRSIYARDKLITNEFVYNRIRVTEDEEVITSNGKIKEAQDNDDGTYTITLDLREGDYNPFAAGDLLQGYYHSPGNSGVIYAKQNLTVLEDPDNDQTMKVICEGDSLPYKHMVIVRVGNTHNRDRQCFIKISSRTNSQYFFDKISRFEHLDNPDYIKCVLGKIEPGLLPVWAQGMMGDVAKWFGLIADGVVLRGSFILKNDKTVEETLDDEVTTKVSEKLSEFQITEEKISGKVSDVTKIAEDAERSANAAADSAGKAAGAADTAGGKLTQINTKVSEFEQTAQGFSTTVSDVEKLVNEATGIETKISDKVTSFEQTAKGFSTTVGDVKKLVDEATGIETEISKKVTKFNQTADGFESTVSQTAEDVVNGAVAAADSAITSKVVQHADAWKVELLKDGSEIVAAINASAEGVAIEGKRIELNGDVIAKNIKASGLNIDNKFVVEKVGSGVNVTIKGKVEADSGMIGTLSIKDGGITGIDNNGNIQLAITNKPLSSIKDLENSEVEKFTSRTSSYYYELKTTNTTENISIKSSTLKIKKGCLLKFTYKPIESNTFEVRYTPYYQAKLMNCDDSSRPYFVKNINLGIGVESEVIIPEKGNYYIQFEGYVDLMRTVTGTIMGSVYYNLNNTIIYRQQCTLIGSDGLYSYWGPDGFIYAKRGKDGRMDIRMRGNIYLEDLGGNTFGTKPTN